MSLKLALLPVIGPQALLARRRARILPEPPGARAGRAGSGPPLRLLIAGDSSAAGVGCAVQDQALSGRLAARLSGRFDLSWQVAARTGAVTAQVPDLIGGGPWDVAVLSIGLNDVTRGTPIGRWLVQRAALFERLAPARLVVSGLPPLGAFPALPQPLRWVMGRELARYEAAGRAQAEALGHRFAPLIGITDDVSLMAEDGFHPGPAVYDMWADLLVPRVVEAAAQAA